MELTSRRVQADGQLCLKQLLFNGEFHLERDVFAEAGKFGTSSRCTDRPSKLCRTGVAGCCFGSYRTHSCASASGRNTVCGGSCSTVPVPAPSPKLVAPAASASQTQQSQIEERSKTRRELRAERRQRYAERRALRHQRQLVSPLNENQELWLSTETPLRHEPDFLETKAGNCPHFRFMSQNFNKEMPA
jgi:hypothetical protein